MKLILGKDLCLEYSTHLSVLLGLLIVPLVMSALSKTAGRVAPPDVDSLTRETPSEEHVENLFRSHITLEPVGGVVLVKVAVPSTSAKVRRCQEMSTYLVKLYTYPS